MRFPEIGKENSSWKSSLNISLEAMGFDEKILSMYARGMTTREISGYLKEIHNPNVLPELIRRATDFIKELIEDWRKRSLYPFYPILFLDALAINIKENTKVINK